MCRCNFKQRVYGFCVFIIEVFPSVMSYSSTAFQSATLSDKSVGYAVRSVSKKQSRHSALLIGSLGRYSSCQQLLLRQELASHSLYRCARFPRPASTLLTRSSRSMRLCYLVFRFNFEMLSRSVNLSIFKVVA